MGVLGLGAGVLAAYGKPGDTFRFYEINPKVIEFARKHFTYLRDSAARVEVVTGDGRIELERELKESGSQQFDVVPHGRLQQRLYSRPPPDRGGRSALLQALEARRQTAGAHLESPAGLVAGHPRPGGADGL